MDQKSEGSARDYWGPGLPDLDCFAEPILLSPRRLVELGLKKGKRFSPREWFKLVATAFLISIDIDATVFSIWWWFIK